jgi:hypothetical protein
LSGGESEKDRRPPEKPETGQILDFPRQREYCAGTSKDSSHTGGSLTHAGNDSLITSFQSGAPLIAFRQRSVQMTKLKDAMSWFKSQFKTQLEAGIRDTPFSLDMLTAIAVQETYYIWGRLYQEMPVVEVLQLCVGDTIDAPGRTAFPRNKTQLLGVPGGDEMFAIAREALVTMARHVPGYSAVARKPNKFCHGFGIFQYDLQFFKDNPDFFLRKRWSSFEECLGLLIGELKAALKSAYGPRKRTLTDEEMVYVAIAYNTGSVNFARKFKQGHRDDSGKYYGEYIRDYLQLARSVS